MSNPLYRHFCRKDARALLLRQATMALDDYLQKTWKRADGGKVQLRIELNPELIEYAYKGDGESLSGQGLGADFNNP